MGATALHRDQLGNRPSEGAKLLWEEIRARGLTLSDLTRLLGSKPGMANRWAWCQAQPSPGWQTIIEDLLGIPASAWGRKAKGEIVPAYLLGSAA